MVNCFVENEMAKKSSVRNLGNNGKNADLTRTLYESKAFRGNWNRLFEKFGRKGQDAKENIGAYYRESIELIRRGIIGKHGSIELKHLEYVPSKGRGRFFECKQHRIAGTNFSPRILFVNVQGERSSILLDVIDKDGNDIDQSVLSSLSSKYKLAQLNDYSSTYSKV